MRALTILACISTLLMAGCPAPQATPPAAIRAAWPVTFEDDFDGTEIDTAKWEVRDSDTPRRPGPFGDAYWKAEDCWLDGEGHLVQRGKSLDGTIDYSSGAMRSRGRFEQTFGYFEIRCKLPEKPGWWSAFWLTSETVGNVGEGGRDGTEIDIMESPWPNTGMINQGLHWDGYDSDHRFALHPVPGLWGIQDGYHTFALEWNEDEYIFYVDDRVTWRTTAGGVSQVPAWVLVTCEITTVLGDFGGFWGGDPRDTDWPDYFYVDYVRVYQDPARLK
jgi:beta-glucanase (GH16 family)